MNYLTMEMSVPFLTKTRLLKRGGKQMPIYDVEVIVTLKRVEQVSAGDIDDACEKACEIVEHDLKGEEILETITEDVKDVTDDCEADSAYDSQRE